MKTHPLRGNYETKSELKCHRTNRWDNSVMQQAFRKPPHEFETNLSKNKIQISFISKLSYVHLKNATVLRTDYHCAGNMPT